MDRPVSLGGGPAPSRDSGPSGLVARLRRFDALCDRFEARWRSDRRLTIEALLAEVTPEERTPLLRELLAVEVELKRRDGVTPLPGDYRDRFRSAEAVVDAIFAGGAFADESSADGPEPPPVASFGDFEVVRELGRGGMGVVYQARQVSLDRMVALKVLHHSGAGGPGDRAERFRREAEAVAALDHPHIVPVLEVGATAGFAYLSMKYLAGGSLARGLPPGEASPRDAARVMVLVAEAVHHAHRRGVLHRDLKPSNILLGDDGRPAVADFGLAKRLDRPDDPSLTRADNLLGTPAYMAPEQARRSHGAVTTATDVYGIGAVLYFLLAGRPPFAGGDIPGLLRDVAERPPEPPSRHRAGVDRDLETICLACLRKEPNRRYASAQAVADDLRRYLAREPIRARPVGRAERLALWCRRQPALAALSAALVAATAGGVAATAVGFARAADQASVARAERDHARRRQEAAERARDLARAAVEAFESALSGEKALRDRPDLADLRRRLLAAPIGYYRKLRDQLRADPDATPQSRRDLAVVAAHLGDAQRELGSAVEARDAYDEAALLYEELGRSAAGTPEDRANHARTVSNAAILRQSLGDFAGARAGQERALAIRRELARDDPDNVIYAADLARSESSLMIARVIDGRLREALALLGPARERLAGAVRARPDDARLRLDLSSLLTNAAHAHLQLGEAAAALPLMDEAIGQQHRAVALAPDDPNQRLFLGKQLAGRAMTRAGLGDADGTRAAYREADAELRALVDRAPTVVEYRSVLAALDNDHAATLDRPEERDEAADLLRRAGAAQAAIAAENPKVAEFVEDEARTRINLGRLERRRGRPAEARAEYARARDRIEALHREGRATPEAVTDLAVTLGRLADLDDEAGRPAEALDARRRAVELLEPRVTAEAGNLDARSALVDLQGALGDSLRRAGDLAGAVARGEEAVRAARDLPEAAPGRRALLGRGLGRLGATLLALNRVGGAVALALERATLAGDDPAELVAAARDLARCAAAGSSDAAGPAVAALRHAARLGGLDVATLDDAALAPLRDRPDFRDLRLDLPFPADPFRP